MIQYSSLPDPYGLKFDDWACLVVEQLAAYALPLPPKEDGWQDWAALFSTLPGSLAPSPLGFDSWQNWARALIGAA